MRHANRVFDVTADPAEKLGSAVLVGGLAFTTSVNANVYGERKLNDLVDEFNLETVQAALNVNPQYVPHIGCADLANTSLYFALGKGGDVTMQYAGIYLLFAGIGCIAQLHRKK